MKIITNTDVFRKRNFPTVNPLKPSHPISYFQIPRVRRHSIVRSDVIYPDI